MRLFTFFFLVCVQSFALCADDGLQEIKDKHADFQDISKRVKGQLPEITARLQSFLAQTPLRPYIMPGALTIERIGVEPRFLRGKRGCGKLLAYIPCRVKQNGRSFVMLFQMRIPSSGKKEEKGIALVYIGNAEVDSLLCEDVFSQFLIALRMSPQKQLKAPFIHIETSTLQKDGRYTQKWSLTDGATGEKPFEKVVSLTPDGKGGSYFSMEIKPPLRDNASSTVS